MKLFHRVIFGLSFAFLFVSCAGGANVVESAKPRLDGAEGAGAKLLNVRISSPPENLEELQFTIVPDLGIETVRQGERFIEIVLARPIDSTSSYILKMRHIQPVVEGAAALPETQPETEVTVDMSNLQIVLWNDMYSTKPLGHSLEVGRNAFRIFVPRGKTVELHVFNRYDDATGTVYPMTNDGSMVFEAFVPGNLAGKFYGYRITERTQVPSTVFKPSIPLDTIFADPYGRAMASSNSYPQKMRSLILPAVRFDWQGTRSPNADISDLVMMETHVRDLSASPTAGSPNPGTFKGILNARIGGLNYLKKVGVNAVEFLPIHDFNNVEPPFKTASFGINNTWNTYARNYWGYMTSNFFSPESYYASDATQEPSKWNGTDGRAVSEFKELVREFHRNGISVILDVVYNHVSGYDENALKIIDMDFYFKKNDRTGTGNEVETRRRMVRKMVLDSLKYWMAEYQIDGFRFDLATSHDRVTIAAIKDELRAINPKVYLIAEPWGGEGATNSQDFITLGWSKWNSGIRDAIRSTNRPGEAGKSWALGTNGGAALLEPFWMGAGEGQPWQLVHYIESHDDTTLGDNLRILSGSYSFTAGGQPNRITDLEAYLKLSPRLIDASRVAAFGLLMAQGPIMLHLGQEWARGKVTPDLHGRVEEVTNKGRIGTSSDNVVFRVPTPNSYSADNETNWINFNHVKLNQELFDYYAGLIRLRFAQPLLRKADPANIITLVDENNSNALSMTISDGNRIRIFAAVNSDPENTASFEVPAGTWIIYADKTRAGTTSLGDQAAGPVTIPPGSSLLLVAK